MIKSELVLRLAKESNLSKNDARQVVDIIFEELSNALVRGDRIELRNFGIFYLKDRKARQARNPKTGEKVQVSDKKIPMFKVGKAIFDALNKN